MQCSDAVCEALFADAVSLLNKQWELLQKQEDVSSQLNDPLLHVECLISNANCDKIEELEKKLEQLSEEANETTKEAQIVESYLKLCA